MAEPLVDAELAVRGAGEENHYNIDLSIDKGRDSRRRYGPFPAAIDTDRLRALSGDPVAYGRALADMLFEADGLREVLSGARWAAEERGVPLRLRLWLADGAEDLHSLRWELLTLPGRSEPLCTREDILFSRFLPSNLDAVPRPRGGLRALAAFANPADLPASLAPIDVPRWVEQARAGLAGMEIAWLPERAGEYCTLDRLAERIYGQDVLFLVCHGKMIDGEGWLLLEDEDGAMARVPAGELTRRLSGASRLPRLAVLVVCESAGASGAETAGAIGPMLIGAGIPAVVAMQDGLTFESAGRLLPALFGALQEDGVIDRAVSMGRRAILGRPDESAPVLFMSLVSGRLWKEAAAEVRAAPEVQAATEVRATAEVQAEAEKRAEEAAAAGGASTVAGPKPVAPSRRPAAQVDQRELYAALSGDAFEMEDLRELCFLLGVDWDNLRGETKTTKAIAMIQYFRARGRYADLVEGARAARPDLEI